jgi:hypothetical protein
MKLKKVSVGADTFLFGVDKALNRKVQLGTKVLFWQLRNIRIFTCF